MKNKIFLLFFVGILFGCTTQKNLATDENSQEGEQSKTETKITKPKWICTKSKLDLLFAGDIMAHKPNFVMKNYDVIWEDVEQVVKSSDLAFANLETTIDDSKEDESYPTFSVNSEYANASVRAGFNVFSLANNHTNDHSVRGIKSTLQWAKKQSAMNEAADAQRNFYFSGIKSKEENFSYSYFDEKDWKILFVAITEILNQWNGLEYINYVAPTEKSRVLFLEKMKRLRQENPCDLLIISVHANDVEYDLSISEKQRTFYKNLLNIADADVVWANHAHVAKPWEIFGDKNDNKLHKLIVYSNGNTISGQRWEPQFSAPETLRDYTGDGLLFRVSFSKNSYSIADDASVAKSATSVVKKIDVAPFMTVQDVEKITSDADIEVNTKATLTSVEPILITTYIDTNWQFLVKKLDEEFISNLQNSGRTTWAKYLEERKKLMQKIQGNTIWQ